MNSAQENLLSVIESALFDQPRKTEEELRQLASGLSVALMTGLTPAEVEQVVRVVEEKNGIRAGLGAIIDDGQFVPWLDDAKSSIDPHYWHRYRKLLVQQGMPRDVVLSLDKVTDSILSRTGNPNLNQAWDRRGMVVGHVQSGKTANYTGLICKAADAGYRLIVVIAGIHNNLRNQTQGRVDEGFIGRDTGRQLPGSRPNRNVIGVGKFDPSRTPVSLTNTLRDFHKDTASTNTSEIDSYKVPVVLVIKKNHRTLTNLLEWLRDNSARGDSEMIDQPMLLIDDEADNASINTKYKDDLVTKINGQIRDLLKMFHRSCYVGYTATPFANIFIDPDQDDEMFKEDLFPRDFIIGLDAPTNYFGGKKIFVDGIDEDGNAIWLRSIKDNEDILPVKHAIDQTIDQLPASLLYALRAFLVARAIRDLRGQATSHCSMLVNASRFTRVQGLIRNRLHEALEKIQNSVRINGSLKERALGDSEIAALRNVWAAEYSEAWDDWETIQESLLDAIASAKVVEVNSRSNDLNYTGGGERGQTVIAVGGFSLSRGLTLEGLTVTWFLRNSMMYDTLMQMGRWFGYRGGYEDLCRIWMPDGAIEWYSFIANATEELHQELKIMERAKATPSMFGLAVRSHPSALMITARNKMGSSEEITTMVGLANKFVETARVSLKDIEKNKTLAKQFLLGLDKAGFAQEQAEAFEGGFLLKNVPVNHIDEFLAGWRNADESVTTTPAPIRNYIRARSSDEMQYWDVLVTGLQSGDSDDALGWTIRPISRYVELSDLKNGFMSFSGRRMRVASRGIEKAGINATVVAAREDRYRSEENISEGTRANYPDSIYREVRERPLFILHLVRPKPPKGEDADDRAKALEGLTAVAWSMSLPASNHASERVAYVVNTRKMIELFGSDEQDEDAVDDHE